MGSETEPLPSSLFFTIKPWILLIPGGGEIDNRDYLPYGISDIALMAVVKYESMKDLLAASSPQKTSKRSRSWPEIGIKDPLVRKAAWTYLTIVPPPSSPKRISHRSNGCCEFIRYLVYDVVGRNVSRWFGGHGDSIRIYNGVD